MKDIKDIFEGKKGPIAENEVKDILKIFEIPTTNYKLVKNEKDLEDLDLKYPLAIKVCSSKILHKTDVNGVKLNIKNQEELTAIFKDFKKRFPKENILIDQMEKKGIEAIIGLTQDPTFGLSIMFGIGGIFTELYEDVSFRIVPIDRYDAEQMTEEIKGKKLFEGFRNMRANKQLVIDLLIKVSKLGEQLDPYLDQLDLNPVFVYEKNLVVVDAKMILK